MATKNEKCGYEWESQKMDLQEEFQKGSFEELIKYSNENEVLLMSKWLNGDVREINQVLMFGTARLSYFEKTIEDDLKNLAAFELGKLAGHLECLNKLEYENTQDKIAIAKLATAKVLNQDYARYLENIILRIYEKGDVTSEDLKKTISLELEDLEYILHILSKHGLICYSETFQYYHISDTGIRVARQLKKTYPN